jgi:arylamine N-acetyltransferase
MARSTAQINADIEQVRCAIREIVAGKRMVVADIGGRIEQYTAVRLSELKEMLSDLFTELANATLAAQNRSRSRILHTIFNKGISR